MCDPECLTIKIFIKEIISSKRMNILESKMNDEKNNTLYAQYVELSKEYPGILVGGRLGQYKYYNMDQVIAAALDMIESI